MRVTTRQTNKVEIFFQTVDLDVAGSNPVTHPITLSRLLEDPICARTCALCLWLPPTEVYVARGYRMEITFSLPHEHGRVEKRMVANWATGFHLRCCFLQFRFSQSGVELASFLELDHTAFPQSLTQQHQPQVVMSFGKIGLQFDCFFEIVDRSLQTAFPRH